MPIEFQSDPTLRKALAHSQNSKSWRCETGLLPSSRLGPFLYGLRTPAGVGPYAPRSGEQESWHLLQTHRDREYPASPEIVLGLESPGDLSNEARLLL